MRPVRNVLTALAVTGLAACSADFDNPVGEVSYDAGQVDLSTYVAVGDSLTAGYADGAVYISGQEASFANIMAQQFAKVGGGTFRQPLMDDEIGGLLFSGVGLPDPVIEDPRLVFDLAAEAPVAIDGTPTTEINPALNQNPLSGAYNNTGIPGAKSFHLVAADYGNVANVAAGTANPYFVRFASTASATAIADAAAQQPSFFTLWIGNNDVLAYATSGGTGTDQTGNTDVSTYGGTSLILRLLQASIVV